MKPTTVLSSTAASLLFAGLMSWSAPSHAVAYGEPDCSGLQCNNPNVVMLVGIVADPGSGTPYATTVLCSGSLIGKYEGADQQSYYLFLTAGHCTRAWAWRMAYADVQSVGVSFDPSPAKQANFQAYRFDPDAFAQGGEPVSHPDQGPVNAFNYLIDYGAVSVPAFTVEAKWPQAAQIAPVLLASDLAMTLDAVVASTSLPQKNLVFHAVGYGVTEFLDVGGNAGGLNQPLANSGTRRIAAGQPFQNLRSTLLQTSGNPVQGETTTCSGDSGGPVFLDRPQGPKVQVGVTSSGDNNCHATNLYARTDIVLAKSFIACVRAHADNLSACGMP